MGAFLTYARPYPPLPPCLCAPQTVDLKGRTFSQKHSGMFRTDRVIVESSPRYIFSPIAPYRIQMVRPGAKFIVVLRDPTDRYVYGACPDICFIPKKLDCCWVWFRARCTRCLLFFRSSESPIQDGKAVLLMRVMASRVSACGRYKQRAMILR